MDALQQRLDVVEQRVHVETRLLTQGEVDALPLVLVEQLFFVAQEALNNVLRHANASDITVRVQAEDEQVVLTVADNGIGFDPSIPSFGLGLETIRERAETIGGQVEIISAPQQGTAITVTVALRPDKRV